jgi:hypothetical protein
MKRILLVVAIIFIAVTVQAADVSLSWDAVAGATSYRIQMSTDQGATWTQEKNVPSGTALVWTGAPDSGLLLFRAVAINSAGTSIRSDAGAWFNGSWKLPSAPGKLGMQ